MANLYIARTGVITIFSIMSRRAIFATSWGRIRISIIHFPLKLLALLPTPFLFHTLLPVPETRIGDLTIIYISFSFITGSNFHYLDSVPAFLLKFAQIWYKQNR
ncbi:hypothetical protein M9H77_22435 [Catharanthus roseus]|uniref:Uncharacterized protein n=1 Tax=Catharanthus roseus TaxID=4058 RepID=A0ACC0ARP5_CATRO|nr:hypothetical protein M9H77_22435 [Catharanthus roseus]